MTVAELLQRISGKELREWMAFNTLEPFGGDAPYIGHGITASTIANVNRKKGAKPYKVSDFVPKFEKQEQSVDQMLQMAEMLTIGLGGQDLRPDGPGDEKDENE